MAYHDVDRDCGHLLHRRRCVPPSRHSRLKLHLFLEQYVESCNLIYMTCRTLNSLLFVIGFYCVLCGRRCCMGRERSLHRSEIEWALSYGLQISIIKELSKEEMHFITVGPRARCCWPPCDAPSPLRSPHVAECL